MISTAAAILGAAVIGGVGSAMASGKAAKASEHAADESAAVQREIYQQQRADQQPYVQAGYGAVNRLQNRLGLSTQGTGQPPAPTYGDNGMPPPVNRTSVVGAQGMGGYGPSVGVNGAAPGDPGYDPTGGSRNVAPTGGPGVSKTAGGFAGTSPLQTAGAGDPYYMPDGSLSNAQPGGNALTGAAPGQETDPGTYGTTANPTWQDPGTYQAPAPYETPAYTAPADFSFNIDDFTKNPAYQFALSQGTGQVLAPKGATGAMHSGAALKALQDRGQQTAYNFYAPERAFAYGQYNDNRNFGRSNYENDRNFGYGNYVDQRNFGRASFDTDRAFGRGIYEGDRNYLTSRFDQGTNDLFRLTGVGTGAAGASGAAGQNYANAMTGIVSNNAANQGNAAIAGSNNMTALLGSGVNAMAYYNGARGAPAGTSTANFLQGASAANPYLW